MQRVFGIPLFGLLVSFAVGFGADRAFGREASKSSPGTATVKEAVPTLGGDLRAPSPKILDPSRRGYFQVGIGPAYGFGMQSDSGMYNFNGSYNFNLSEQWTAKVLGDFYVASGSVSSRLFNYGVGAEYYIGQLRMGDSIPYVGADAGLAFGRNAKEQEAAGLGLGIGAGFKFQAADLNWDLNLHYEQLTAQIADAAPGILAFRASVTF